MTSLPLVTGHQTIAAASCRCACTRPVTARREGSGSFVRLRLSPDLFDRLANPVVRLDFNRHARGSLGVLFRRRVNGFASVVCQT